MLPKIDFKNYNFQKAMKSMKSMKAKKAMKSMKKRAMKKSIIAKGRMAKVMVFKGKKVKTVGGLKKDSLTKNKHGRVVSKKLSAKGKKSKWMTAVVKARAALKVKGFCAVGGKTAAGKALLAKAKSFYKK